MDNMRAGNPYAEQIETEIICLAVIEAISAMLTATRLSEREVLAILEHIGVNSLGEIEGALKLVSGPSALEASDAEHLGATIRNVIMDIAVLAEIDPDEFARILTGHRAGTVADICRGLRAGGWKGDRDDHGAAVRH